MTFWFWSRSYFRMSCILFRFHIYHIWIMSNVRFVGRKISNLMTFIILMRQRQHTMRPNICAYHYDDVTWTSCSLKSTAFADQQQSKNKIHITGALWGEFTGDWWIPSQRASNAVQVASGRVYGRKHYDWNIQRLQYSPWNVYLCH